MTEKVTDLTVDELKEIISAIIDEKLSNLLEDTEALSSSSYIDSIREAREDYQSGRVKDIDDLLKDEN